MDLTCPYKCDFDLFLVPEESFFLRVLHHDEIDTAAKILFAAAGGLGKLLSGQVLLTFFLLLLLHLLFLRTFVLKTRVNHFADFELSFADNI